MFPPSSAEPPPDRPESPATPARRPRGARSEAGTIIVRILVGFVVTAIVGFGLLVGFCTLGR